MINDDCTRISFFGDEYVKNIKTGTEFIINDKNEKKYRAILHSMSLTFSNSGFIIDSTKPDQKRRALIIKFMKPDLKELDRLGMPLVSSDKAEELLIKDIYNFIAYCRPYYYDLLDEKGNFKLLPDVEANIENSDEEAIVFRDHILNNYKMEDRNNIISVEHLLSLKEIYDEVRSSLTKSKYERLNNNSLKLYIQKAAISLFEEVQVDVQRVNNKNYRGIYSIDKARVLVKINQ